MTTETFENYYKQLNLEQREAVDAIEGPVMVVAGPGTGKTHLLSMRIANILAKTDTEPESILALTFTESGAASMRKKLVKIIGSAAYGVEISTFHGFCNKIIKEYPDEFPTVIGANNISEVEQVQILQKIIDEKQLKYLKPFGNNYFYLKSIISSINHLKREGICPEEYQKKVSLVEEEKQLNRNMELAEIYKEYQEELRKNRFYDYGDMIMETARTLEANKGLLLILQEKYQYILVDEHQDTNNAQNKILELLASYFESPNLFIVGDEKQAIYRFQGASLENFNYFKNLFEPKIIHLKSNYRSSQMILDAAKTNLIAKSERKESPVCLRIFQNSDEELFYLAKDISEHLNEEIAILYRENKEAGPIARMLEKKGIPHTVESDQNSMEDEDIKKFFIILKTIQNFGSPAEFIQMLHLNFLNIPAYDIYEISRDPYGIIKERKSPENIYRIYENLSKWKKSSLNENPIRIFEEIVRESGFLNYLLSLPKASEKIKKLHSFFNRLKDLVLKNKNYTLNDFFNYLDVLQEQNIFVKTEIIPEHGKVRLMTAHKSKGLEFDRVYIVNAGEKWGKKKIKKYIKLPLLDDEEDDDRNLFYVALTRAREKLIVSCSGLPSKYILEIDEKYFDKKEINEEPDFALEFSSPLVGKEIKEKGFLNELFFKYGLSATALNNYLECPWKYFYRNLIRIPEAPNKHLMLGTAIHAALKNFFESEKMDKDFLISKFCKALNSQPLAESQYLEMLEKGKKALSGYFEKYSSLWNRNAFFEYNIRGVDLGQGIVINGKLDKIEILDSANSANVVDYKTGKRKHKENYFRQLVFYKLLLDNYKSQKFKMVSGEIDFVEPDEKGNYRKEKFEIRKEDAEQLKEKIIQVSNEIINLNFWNRFCQDSACPYCQMRKLMVN